MEWKEKTLFERIKDRWTEKDQVYSRLNNARESIVNLFRPDLGVDVDENNDMLMLGGDIYDGSPTWVARTATTAFQGNTVSKKLDWFKYGFSDSRLAGIDELDKFCQAVKEHNAHVYQQGSFYDVQPLFTLDAWTTGSPVFFIEEHDKTGNVMCLPVHWKTFRLFYNRYNETEGIIIKDPGWTVKRIFDKFVPDGSIEQRLEKAKKLFSQGLYNSLWQGRFNDRYTIWRAVFQANDPLWQSDITMPVGNREWIDVYYEDLNEAYKSKDPLLVTGYYSMPFVTWDYDKKPWETASRTPAFHAVYDNLSLQQIFKSYLDNMKLKVRPSMMALMSMKNRLRLGAEEITYVDQKEWDFVPRPIEQIGDIRLEPETVQMIKENLSRWFHLEMFRMFSDLAQQTNQEFRVLQLAEMAGERITQLLPTIETHEGYLSKVDRRVREIERRKGLGPYNRRDMENIFDIIEYHIGASAYTVDIAPEFIGTLRQAQQMQQKLKPLQYGMGALNEIATAMGDPNLVRFMVKPYNVGDSVLTAVNFPQELINEQEDYQKLVAEFMKSQAQREQFAQIVELMKAAKGAKGMLDPSSMAGLLTGAAA